MPLIFDMSDEEKDAVTLQRNKRIRESLKATEEIERWLELQGGRFIGIDESGLKYGFDNKAFEDLFNQLFREEKK